MKPVTRFYAIVLLLALGAAGCASAQSKDNAPMLIDKIPTTIWNIQILLTPDQHKDDQQTLVSKLEQQLKGQYRITGRHIYLLPPDEKIIPNPVIFKGDFHTVMNEIDPAGSELVFTNETIDWPYVNVWKTSGPQPEYVALALYRMSDDTNTLLGYFELEPTK